MDFEKERQELTQRRQELEKKRKEWETKKKDHLMSLKVHSDSMGPYLGKIEQGLNYTGDLIYHVDKMKEIFEQIEEAEKDLKNEEDDIEADDDNLRWEIQHSRNRERVAMVLKGTKI